MAVPTKIDSAKFECPRLCHDCFCLQGAVSSANLILFKPITCPAKFSNCKLDWLPISN